MPLRIPYSRFVSLPFPPTRKHLSRRAHANRDSPFSSYRSPIRAFRSCGGIYRSRLNKHNASRAEVALALSNLWTPRHVVSHETVREILPRSFSKAIDNTQTEEPQNQFHGLAGTNQLPDHIINRKAQWSLSWGELLWALWRYPWPAALCTANRVILGFRQSAENGADDCEERLTPSTAIPQSTDRHRRAARRTDALDVVCSKATEELKTSINNNRHATRSST